jgi:hypothetical protein
MHDVPAVNYIPFVSYLGWLFNDDVSIETIQRDKTECRADGGTTIGSGN